MERQARRAQVLRHAKRIFARKGYRALRTTRSADTGSYETPALALLDRTPLPNAFPVHAAAFSFPASWDRLAMVRGDSFPVRCC